MQQSWNIKGNIFSLLRNHVLLLAFNSLLIVKTVIYSDEDLALDFLKRKKRNHSFAEGESKNEVES